MQIRVPSIWQNWKGGGFRQPHPQQLLERPLRVVPAAWRVGRPASLHPQASFYVQIERCAGVPKQSCSVRLEEDDRHRDETETRRKKRTTDTVTPAALNVVALWRAWRCGVLPNQARGLSRLRFAKNTRMENGPIGWPFSCTNRWVLHCHE